MPCSPEPVSPTSVILHLTCFEAVQRLLFSPFPAMLPHPGFLWKKCRVSSSTQTR